MNSPNLAYEYRIPKKRKCKFIFSQFVILERSVFKMTNVEKFYRLLKDIDVLNKHQEQYKREILDILMKEDAKIMEEIEEGTV